MMQRRPTWVLVIGLCLGLFRPAARAQDLLDLVPHDALAFVVVRDIASVRTQISRFADPNAPNPLIDLFPESLINAAIGNNPGLNARGDLLFVLHASDRPLTESPLSVWLPVRDYAAFVRGLRGNADDRITVITVQRQDMLCAKQGAWALIMDATDRERMEATLGGPPKVPARVAAWRELFTANPISAGILQTDASRRTLRGWYTETAAQGATLKANSVEQGMFPPISGAAPLPVKQPFVEQFEELALTSPRLFALLQETDALAVGVRIENGDLRATIRAAWPKDPWQSTDSVVVAPALHREGEFTFSGSGLFPAVISRGVTQSVAQSAVNQLTSENQRTAFDPALVAKFLTECDTAAGLVRSATIFHSPGGDEDGVYTNQFLAVRVESAQNFMTQVGRVVTAWNELNDRARPASKFLFESKSLQIAGKTAAQYSLDIVAADGLRDEPSMRQLMVRLFGPDRKLQRFAVQVDDRTVLLAGATQNQVAAALKYIKDAKPSVWNASSTAMANKLTPEAPDWKLFFSPAGYVKWLKRTNDVNFGDVIGAPPINPFPLTAPVAIAGNFPSGELSVEFAVPSDALRHAQNYRVQLSRAARAAQ
jgi:hypothetical protein